MLTNLSDLDLRLIRVFLAVVDARGISVAQSTLNVGQSTLSAQLSTLEVRLGYRLAERGRSGFRLTPKGERFEAAARQLMDTIGDFCHLARHIDRKLVGQLRLGLIDHAPAAQHARIGQAITRFRRRDEAVRFDIRLRTPEEIEQELLAGTLALAIGYFWHRVPSLEYAPLFVEEQLAYCGRGHPLFNVSGAISMEEAEQHEWVGRSYPVSEADGRQLAGRIAVEADNMDAVAILITSGRYCGYLPATVAAPYRALGLLRPLHEQQLRYEVPIHAVTPQAARRDEITEAFLEDLLAEYAAG